MKNKILQFASALLIALGIVSFGKISQAKIAVDFCEVENPNDVASRNQGDPVRIVVDWANSGTRNGVKRCAKGIKFKKSIVFMDTLRFAIPETKESDNYTIEGDLDGTGAPVVLDFSNIHALADVADLSKLCAIYFQSTRYITFKNIIINAGPFNGICLGGKNEGSDTRGIIFNNVKIDGAAGHGFVFLPTAKDNIILANSSVLHVGKDAIRVLNDSATDFNLLQSTNRIAKQADPETGLLDPETGFESPVDDAGNAIDEKNFSFYGSQNFVSSKRAIRVRIATPKQLDPENPNVFLIQGQVVQASSNEEVCNAALGVRGITRLQIYSAQRQVGKVGTFLTYVMPSTTDSLLGIVTASEVQGRFSFIYDKSKYAAEYIAILPELSSSDQRVPNGTKIASSSRIIQVTDRNPEGVIVCPGDADGSGSIFAGAGAGRGAGIVSDFTTVGECLNRRGSGVDDKPLASFGEGRDSDGDGIKDYLEDSDSDCRCGPNDISCWLSADTDEDGIPDGQELGAGSIRNINFLKTTGGVQQSRNDIAFCSDDLANDPCDIDGDHISNAYDEDSDKDGLNDVREDRSLFFQESSTGYLYYYNGADSNSPVGVDATGGPSLTCTFVSSKAKAAGIEYALYIVTPAQGGQAITVRRRSGEERANANTGETLRLLACKNPTVGSKNFDGLRNDETETDPYRADAGVDVLGNTTDCSMILRPVQQNMRNGSIRGWLEANKSDPDLIKRECVLDTDLDGIPDCVELPTGQCNDIFGRSPVGRYLNPFKADTDGDGVNDRVDLDPFHDLGVRGRDGDEYPAGDAVVADAIADDPVTGINRASLYRVFIDNPYVMLFTDRDQDEINDGEEIRSLRVGGPVLDSRAITVPGLPNCAFGVAVAVPSTDPRCLTDSDPLRKDTDRDGIDDKTEIRTWGRQTNPATTDTDGDELSDRLEVVGDQIEFHINPVGNGCGILNKIAPNVRARSGKEPGDEPFRVGTLPDNPDSDGDGIRDGKELSCDPTLADDISRMLAGSFPAGGIDVCSNPLSPDSDGDGIKDGDEYGADGVIDWGDSNPCDRDTDHAQGIDGSDACNTSTDTNATCAKPQAGTFSTGTDTDGDKLSNEQELNSEYKSDPNRADSDGDGLSDGEEDANLNGRFEANLGESHPVNADTDGDGLRDSFERQFGADPNNTDTDRDGLLDGVEIINQNSLDTDPTNPDTDGDGLCDGGRAVNFAGPAGNVNCIRGEDINENGVVDKDPKNPNQVIETDPRNPDSDSDGELDKDEICHGGSCNIAGNLGRATQGKSEGCFSVSGRHSGDNRAPTSMFYLLGLLLIGNRLMTRQFRKRSALN